MKTFNYFTVYFAFIFALTSCQKKDVADPQMVVENTVYESEYVTLQSGVVVEKVGENYLFQGDVLLSEAQFKLLDEKGELSSPIKEDIEIPTGTPVPASSGQLFAQDVGKKSVGVHPNENRMWAMVRYAVNSNLSAGARLAVTQAIEHIEATTNIRFYNVTGQPVYDYTYNFYYPYIEFFHGTSNNPNDWNKKGNWSTVGRWDAVKNHAKHGRNDGGQWVSLQQDLFGSVPSGVVVHEIMHAIGLYHEHTRPDRNSFITVHTSRIDPNLLNADGIKANFDPIGGNYYMFGSVIDYNSIMMYGATDFALNASLPVITVNAGGTYTKNRTSLSSLDRAYANYFYLPYVARSDTYAELAPVVYDGNNVALTPTQRLNLQGALNYGNPTPPNCCRLPNVHTGL